MAHTFINKIKQLPYNCLINSLNYSPCLLYMTDYKAKYEKYKNKYIQLKIIKTQQSGGARDYFKSNIKVHVLAVITNPELITLLDQQRQELNLWELHRINKEYHMTLMQFHINANHPDSYIFDEKLESLIGKWYDETFGGIDNPKGATILKHKMGDYDLLGQEKKYLVKLYEPLDKYKTVITDFRKKLYKYIDKRIKKGKSKKIFKKTKDDVEYYIISYGGQKLLSIPSYYYGIGKWVPHISIADLGEIEKYSPNLFEKYEDAKSKEDKLSVLLKPIIGANLDTLPKINMNQDIGSIKVSFHHKKDPYWSFGLKVPRI